MTESTPARLRPVPPPEESPEPRRGSLEVVEGAPEPESMRLLLLLLGTALLPRLLLMRLNENLYGDAVVRTELAMRWARDPHWISSFADGAFQFGPLQLYLVGLVLKVGVGHELAGRLVGLVFGTATAVPLFVLARRLFDWRAGVVAGLAFSVWGMHLQMSTTGGSEALALFLFLSILVLLARALDENRLAPIFGAALLLNLGCATRYEFWLLIPLIGLLLFVGDKDRVAAITRAVLFVLLCLAFPLAWMQGNEIDTGHALYPMRYIEEFHRDWVGKEVGMKGSLPFRLQALAFWPGVALLTLTPAVAVFGMVGMARAWRERPAQRWVLWVCWAPTLYFSLRAAVFVSVVPLARFTAAQVVLLLPYVEPGFRAVMGKAPAGARRWVAGGTAALAVAIPLWLGAFTFRSEGRLQDALRPVSPTSTNPSAVMQVARYLEQEVARKGGAFILDEDPDYNDIQIRFFSGVPEERTAPLRWQGFSERVRALDPGHMVRREGGALDKLLVLSSDGQRARLGALEFVEVPGFSPPFRVYERRR